MKAKKTEIPKGSLINKYLPADHTDAFRYSVSYAPPINPDDVMVNFWTKFPAWVDSLFRLRNFLAKFVGLERENNSLQQLEDSIRKGESHNFVSVSAKNEHETVILLIDKHLNAYLSVYIEDKQERKEITATTLVHFHNRLGRVYFFFIRPFHNLIIKTVLQRAVDHIIHK